MPKSKSKSKKRKTSQHHANETDELSHAEIWDDSALLRSWDEALGEYEYYHSIHARGEDVDKVLRQAELDEQQASRAAKHARVPGRTITQNDVHGNANANAESDAGIDMNAGSEDGEVESDGGRGTNASRANVHVVPSTEGEGEDNMKLRTRVPSHLDDDDDHDDHEEGELSGTAPAPAERLAPGAHGTRHGPYLPSTRSPAVDDRSRLPSIFVDDEDDAPSAAAVRGGGQAPNLRVLPVPADQTLENIKMAYYWAGYYSGLYDGQQQGQGQASQERGMTGNRGAR